MNIENNLTMPLQSIFWSKQDSLAKKSALILFGVIILAIASQLSIPLHPVPLTFQSTAVVLIGMIYGSRFGSMVVIAYLLAGLSGLPLFAGFTAGLSPFFDPAGGYLLGFLPAAFIAGYLTERGFAKHIFSSFIVALLAVSMIFALGLLVLTQLMGWQNAITFGLMPFLITEPIKIFAISLLVPKCWKKTSRDH